MDIESPFLLYGAGREARSSLEFLSTRLPQARFLVTADNGRIDLPGAQTVPIDTAMRMVESRQIGTIVKSPGIPPHKPLLQQARTAGVPITTNLNLWGKFIARPQTLVAITGTKGKSTTASLLAAMLHEAGKDVVLAGNVGVAPLQIRQAHEVVVFELSSYQIADLEFGADIVGITTLYPEHTDWHGSTEQYFADKLSILDKSPSARLAFGPQAATHPLIERRPIDPARLLPALEESLDDSVADAATRSALKGPHNLDNVRLAARIAVALGADDDAIAAAVEAFEPLPHRLAPFAIGGKLFVDDSIATTPEATKAALRAYFGQRIALIAGGYDRGQTYDDLVPVMLEAGVELVLCLPDTGKRIAEAVARDAPRIAVVQTPDLEQAMAAAHLRQAHFDTLLLSPGAPSFNQFVSFEQRGERFIALAHSLFG